MLVNKRTNGFSWPPDKAQLFSWLLIIYFGLSMFGSFCVSLTDPWIYLFTITASIVYVVHVVLNIIVMSINPGEEVSLRRKIMPENDFDRDKHKHVIENQFCNICKIVVSFKTKHCKRCNKCITHFDHHCVYLNNCIGSRNYKLFIFTIVSAFIGTMYTFLLGIVEFIISFRNSQSFLTTKYFHIKNSTICNEKICPDEFKAFLIFVPVNVNGWRAYVMITSILALVAAFLIGYLIIYHIFLTVKNMTTYEHAIKLRLENEEKKKKREKMSQQDLNSVQNTKNSTFSSQNSQTIHNINNSINPNSTTNNDASKANLSKNNKNVLPSLFEPIETNVDAEKTSYDRENKKKNFTNQKIPRDNTHSNRTFDNDFDYYKMKNYEYSSKNEHAIRNETSIPCINSSIHESYLLNENENSMSERSEQNKAEYKTDKLPRLLPPLERRDRNSHDKKNSNTNINDDDDIIINKVITKKNQI